MIPVVAPNIITKAFYVKLPEVSVGNNAMPSWEPMKWKFSVSKNTTVIANVERQNTQICRDSLCKSDQILSALAFIGNLRHLMEWLISYNFLCIFVGILKNLQDFFQISKPEAFQN